jgi:glycosyltransferase involved in cell wall biosynthesis
MKISIVIPTHNRAESLRRVIDSVTSLREESDFEFVIVDNNSTDHTKEVALQHSSIVKYVFEPRTSFTRARKTGGENASGDILLYLDDDVIVNPGSLKSIRSIFEKYSQCGVIAGKILPQFETPPPQWALDCQKSFNGWSLLGPDVYSTIRNDFQEFNSAAGPMMAIRRKVYDEVGGFPPDTIGVESNSGKKTFNKLYIGPGDYGLCHKARLAGWKIFYSDDVSVYHVIPPMRFTIKFWRSRMIGEAYHDAITMREFFKTSEFRMDLKRYDSVNSFNRAKKMLMARLDRPDFTSQEGMCIHELWALYHKAFIEMDQVLRENPGLSRFLWEIGDAGVDDSNFDQVMSRLPKAFKDLVHNDVVFNPVVLSKETYGTVFKDFGLRMDYGGATPENILDFYTFLRRIKNVMRAVLDL